MSYLNFPRINFSGLFQADVSTINNDPRHFDNGTFEPYFQEFQNNTANGPDFNGWWNPVGTGIFRLNNCMVSSILGPDGKVITSADIDPIVGLQVGNAPNQPSGKLVDLDPDWQNASEIFGLSVSLLNAGGEVIMVGRYEAAPFRDLWFTRTKASGDMGASAMFQSVLTDIEWHDERINSHFLEQLRLASEEEMLSIRLTTYAYQMNAGNPLFTYGTLIGSIGPYRSGEPRSFVSGRRFMPTTTNSQGNNVSNNGITCFPAVIDQATKTIQLDLSNALPLVGNYAIANLGNLIVGILKNPLTAQDAEVNKDDYINLGPLNYSQSNQMVESGIIAAPLFDDAMKLVENNPLAFIIPIDTNDHGIVCVREVLLGLEVRPDKFTFRLCPDIDYLNKATTTFYATEYGRPKKNAELTFWQTPPSIDADNTPVSATPGATPAALLTVNDVPSDAIRIEPERPVTDEHGRATVTLHAPEYMGSPREYMDGQLYTISYNFSGNNPAIQQLFDKFAIVVYSNYEAKDDPVWDDVQPILQQYANLYPVMSQGLFDFSQQAQADKNAFILHFVFSKNFYDPDYMPVTRDLSEPKRRTLLNYFEKVMTQRKQSPITSFEKFSSRCPLKRTQSPSPQQANAIEKSIVGSKFGKR